MVLEFSKFIFFLGLSSFCFNQSSLNHRSQGHVNRKISSGPYSSLGPFPYSFVQNWNGLSLEQSVLEFAQAPFLPDPLGSHQRITLFSPQGRSPQRDQYSFQTPRVLHFLNHPEGPSFLAYAAGENFGEIISWSRHSRKFIFLQKERENTLLKPANTEFCFSCHQNSGPIFTRKPWRETSSRFILDELRKNHPTLQISDVRLPDSHHYLMQRSSAFDLAIRYASYLAQAGKVFNGICDNSLECKKQLILLSFWSHENFLSIHQDYAKFKIFIDLIRSNFTLPNRSDLPELKRQLLDRLGHSSGNNYFSKIIRGKYPQNNFAYPSSTLADQDHLGAVFRFNQTIHSNSEEATYDDSYAAVGKDLETVQMLRAHHNHFEEVDENQANQVGGLLLLESTISEDDIKKQFSDPKTHRPLTHSILVQDATKYLSFISGKLIGFNQNEWDQLKVIKPRDLSSLMNAQAFKRFLRLFKHMPPPALLAQVLMQLKNKIPIDWNFVSKSSVTFHQKNNFLNTEEITLSQLNTNEENIWYRNCGSCHNGGELPLPLHSSQEMSQYRAKLNNYKSMSVEEILKNNLMPLDDISAEEKEALLKEISQDFPNSK